MNVGGVVGKSADDPPFSVTVDGDGTVIDVGVETRPATIGPLVGAVHVVCGAEHTGHGPGSDFTHICFPSEIIRYPTGIEFSRRPRVGGRGECLERDDL